MTDKEIIFQVLDKATMKGYYLPVALMNYGGTLAEICDGYDHNHLTADTIDGHECYPYSLKEILFSHDFAKAFWGKDET